MKTTVNLVASLNAPVTIQASAEGDDGPKRFRASPAYSGGLVSGATAKPALKFPYVMDVSGMVLGKNAKANLDHKQNQRVGHLTIEENDGRSFTVEGLLSAATSHRDEVANSSANQYTWEGSIEAELDSKPTLIAAGKTVSVNGQTFTGPLYVFKRSVVTGLAFVSHGADEGNNLQIAAEKPLENTHMNEFDTFVVSCGADPENLTDVQRAHLTTAFNATKTVANVHTGTAPRSNSFAELAEREEAENERRLAILKIGDRYMKNNPYHIAAIRMEGEKAIEDGSAPDQFELHLIRAGRVQGGKIMTEVRGNVSDKVIECALSLSAGIEGTQQKFGAEICQAVEDADMRGYGLHDLLLHLAKRNGMENGKRVTSANLRRVLQYAFPSGPTAQLAGMTTSSLPGILGNIANKQIESGYKEEDPTWREFAKIKPVNNFYQQTHYRMLDSVEYEEVGSGGELKHGTLGQESFTSQAKTYGKMIGLTRSQIINDDLGAFDDIRERLGRGGAKKFNNVFWAAFINNSNFFTSALTNYISGSTTNLALDGVGLELGLTAAQQMTTPSADGLKRVGAGITPKKLLVPPELQFIAERLFISDTVNTGGSSSSTLVPNANIHKGRYMPIVQWRLSNSAYTGYSTTAWYLMGGDLQPMLVTFLNGNQSPFIESTDADFDTLGILFRGYHDFGCDKSEYLSGVKSKGAS